jgi:2-aminoadipate transaminase
MEYEVIKGGFLDEHIPQIRERYRLQCRVMLDALREFFPASVQWNEPAGGMFIWVKLPAGIDSMLLLDKAIAENVAFVPGAPFFANDPQSNTLRLSFVTVSQEKIREGIAKLGALIKREIEGL